MSVPSLSQSAVVLCALSALRAYAHLWLKDEEFEDFRQKHMRTGGGAKGALGEDAIGALGGGRARPHRSRRTVGKRPLGENAPQEAMTWRTIGAPCGRGNTGTRPWARRTGPICTSLYLLGLESFRSDACAEEGLEPSSQLYPFDERAFQVACGTSLL